MEHAPPQIHVTRAEIVTGEPVQILVDSGGLWAQVLVEYLRDISPTLSAGPLRVMNFMFLHRDRSTGLIQAQRRDIGHACQISKATTTEAITHLVTHPLRPLAEPGASVFEPMPGRRWRVRRGEPEFAQPNRSSPSRTGVRPAELDAIGDQETRARNQPDQRLEELKQEPKADARCAGNSGLAGRCRPPRSNAPALATGTPLFAADQERALAAFRALELAGVNEPARSLLADCTALTAEIVARTGAAVLTDKDVLNPGAVVASRLARRLGITLPTANPRMERLRVGGADMGAMASIARMRNSKGGR